MKITKSQLKKIIMEELEECMDMMGGEMPMQKPSIKMVPVTPDHHGDYDGAGRMTKSNLYNMVKHATMLHELIQDNQELEPWVQEKIAVATDAIETVAEYMEYEKTRGR